MKKAINTITCTSLILLLSACGDSGSKKWRLDNKNLTQSEVAALKVASAFKDDIAQRNGWADLDGAQWADMLAFFPEESKKCAKLEAWNKLNGADWARLLSEEPRFGTECDKRAGWKTMASKDWIRLLIAQAEFISKADEHNAWEAFAPTDWEGALLSGCEALKKQCDKRKAWEKFDKKTWTALLSSDMRFADDADIYGAWKLLDRENWLTLFAKDDKFIGIAKRENFFETLDIDAWISLVEANGKLKDVAEECGVFGKMTPMDWANLLSKDLKYMDIFKSVNSLDKFSDRELIRLYCLQPEIRNEIFALQRIDMDTAKHIEKLRNSFGKDGRNLDAKSLLAVLAVFPELKGAIHTETFQRYNAENWVELLKNARADLYGVISAKFAYLVPWKKFTFSDWVELLDRNQDLEGIFRQNVNLKELTYPDIKRALIKASVNRLDAFEKYDFWKDFTKEQYISLINDKGSETLGMVAFLEHMSGQKIRSAEDMEQAVDNIDSKINTALEKTIFEDTGTGLKDLQDAVSTPSKTKEKRIYDSNYIVEMAKKHNILAQFSDDDWRVVIYETPEVAGDANGIKRQQHFRILRGKNYDSSSREEKEIAKTETLLNEYFKMHAEDPDCEKMIPEFLYFENLKKHSLWGKLSPSQWEIPAYVALMNGFPNNDLRFVKLGRFKEDSADKLAELFKHMNENSMWKKFSPRQETRMLRLTFPFSENESFGKFPIWENEISNEAWKDFFCAIPSMIDRRDGTKGIEACVRRCDWKKMTPADITEIFGSLKSEMRDGELSPVRRTLTRNIMEAFDADRLSPGELLECLKVNLYAAEKESDKDYYPAAMKNFTAQQWAELKESHKNSLVTLQISFEKNSDWEKFSEADIVLLNKAGFKRKAAENKARNPKEGNSVQEEKNKIMQERKKSMRNVKSPADMKLGDVFGI